MKPRKWLIGGLKVSPMRGWNPDPRGETNEPPKTSPFRVGRSHEVFAETEYSKCSLRCLKEFLQSIDIDELTDEEIDQIKNIIRNEFT